MIMKRNKTPSSDKTPSLYYKIFLFQAGGTTESWLPIGGAVASIACSDAGESVTATPFKMLSLSLADTLSVRLAAGEISLGWCTLLRLV